MPNHADNDKEHLIQLARELDKQGSPDVSAAMKLAGDDLAEIGRVQNALGFLDAIRSDIAEEGVTETVANIETHTDPSADVDIGGAKRLPSFVGRFLVEKQIGEGGWAKVFLAFDPQLDRKVALKILRASYVFSSDAAVRFEREAKAMAMLSHPNIVPVFETGAIDSDRFIVSEFCDGVDLECWANEHGPINSRVAANVVVAISEAVAHAHQRGVVHRDLKPANILLDLGSRGLCATLSDDELGSCVRVTDFGLAKYAQPEDSLRTTEGAIVGTPAYMSPEQADGGKEVGAATDIYAIGVILYQLLTGKLPIVRGTHVDTLIAVKQNEIKPPGQLVALDNDLQAICMKCLSVSPAHRYESAFALSADLQRWLKGEPVFARNISAIEKVGRWCKRNPLVAAGVAALVAGLAFALVQWNHATKAIAHAEKSKDLSQETVRQMVNDVATSSKIPPEFARDLIARAIGLQAKLLEENPDDFDVRYETARSYLNVAESEILLRNHDVALDACEKGLAIVDQTKKDDVNTAMVELRSHLVLQQARSLGVLGRTEEVLALIDSAEMQTNDPAAEVVKFMERGRALLNSNDNHSAWEEFGKGLVFLECQPKSENAFAKIMVDSHISILLYYKGTAESKLGRFGSARGNLEQSIEIIEPVMQAAGYHASMADTLSETFGELGEVCFQLGDYEAAITHLEAAIDGFDELYKRNEKVSRYLETKLFRQINLAEAYIADGQNDAGVKLLEDLVDGLDTDDASSALEPSLIQTLLAQAASLLGE